MFQNCDNNILENVSTRHRADGSVESDSREIAVTILGFDGRLQGRSSQVRNH